MLLVFPILLPFKIFSSFVNLTTRAMNINFFLKDKKATKTAILSIMRYKGQRYKLSTGISVEVTYWDAATHRARNTRDYPDHETINIKLEQWEAAAKTLFNEARIKNTIPALDEIKQQCNPKAIKQAPATPTDLFIPQMRHYADTANLKPRTRLFYGTTANILAKYEAAHRTRLTFADINIDFYNSLRKWVNATPRETKEGQPPRYYAANTFGNFIKHIKAVMTATGPDGEKLHATTDYHHRKFVKTTEEADTIYLNAAELASLRAAVINYETVSLINPNLPRKHIALKVEAISKTRNLFLIGCYTALRISDFSRLERYNIGDKYIRIKPRKGVKKNDDVVIPIHPVIHEILAAGFDLSQKMSDQRFNQHLKELAQLAGITKPVTVVRTEGGKQISRTLEKWQLVSSHTARRSGATNMYLAGIPTISIMKITGHKTERSFMRYIRISQEENARLIATHPYFNP